MTGNTAEKLNRNGNSGEKFLRKPYVLLQNKFIIDGKERRLNRSVGKIVSAIYTFSTEDRGESFTYSKYASRFRSSKVTIGRAVRSALAAKLIERGDRAHEFRLTDSLKQLIAESAPKDEKGERGEPRFLKNDEWLYSATFHGKYLTNMQIDVLSNLISWTTDPKKPKKVLVRTNRRLAKGIGCSHEAVNKAISVLKDLGLIAVNIGTVIFDHHRGNEYIVNQDLLKAKKKEIMAQLRERLNASAEGAEGHAGTKSAAVRAADAKAARERYYAYLRNQNEARAAQMKERAMSDDGFRDAEGRVRTLVPKVARAEVFALPELEELRRDLLAARGKRAERLAFIGLTEDDLLPHYKCAKCSDTGYLPNGHMCGCYPQGGRRP